MLEHDRLDFFLDTEAELQEALQEGYLDVDAFQIETLRLTVHLAFLQRMNVDANCGRFMMSVWQNWRYQESCCRSIRNGISPILLKIPQQ